MSVRWPCFRGNALCADGHLAVPGLRGAAPSAPACPRPTARGVPEGTGPPSTVEHHRDAEVTCPHTASVPDRRPLWEARRQNLGFRGPCAPGQAHVGCCMSDQTTLLPSVGQPLRHSLELEQQGAQLCSLASRVLPKV